MAKDCPDHHDAELVLKLYDLRREAVMRASRDAIGSQFWPKTYEDFLAVTKPNHPLNAAFRQVSTYWEMVYGMANHGIVNADYLVENSGEGLFLYGKVEPYLERFRSESNPYAFKNAEWIVKNSEEGQRRYEVIKKRLAKMREQLSK